MSWADYTKLVMNGDAKKSGGVAFAGLFGDNGAVWDQSSGFDVAEKEIKTIVEGLKDTSKFQAGGIVAGGVKYFYTSTTSESIVLGRNKATQTIMILKSKQGFVMAVTKEAVSPGNITMVKFVADDLTTKGY